MRDKITERRMARTRGQRQARARLLLVLLGALFLGGIIISSVLIATGWRPSHTKNYGELAQPAKPLASVQLTTLDGKRVAFDQLFGKWTLVYFGSAECPKACTDNLWKMRQIAAAQGREAGRVQRAFVVTDPKAIDLLRYTLQDYPGMEVFVGPSAAVQDLAKQFALPAGTPLDGLNRVYIVDPLGNFMMSYPADADPRGMNKDLQLLLRASQIG